MITSGAAQGVLFFAAAGNEPTTAPSYPAAYPEVVAVTARTRLVAVSQVLWTTGQLLPVRELRERTGLPILVDGAQSVGAVPVSAEGLDFLTISGQKWLAGPDSTGALVVADPERLRVARPSYFSRREHDPDGSFAPWPGARRFEHCWLATGSLTGLLAALDTRPSWAFERAAEMAERFRARLAAAEVVVRDLPGTDLARASVGWWTSDQDLDRLVDGL